MAEFIYDLGTCVLACTFGLASEWMIWSPLSKSMFKNWRQVRKLR